MNTIESLKAARAIIAVNFVAGQLVLKRFNDLPSCYCSLGALGKVAGMSDSELDLMPGGQWKNINPDAIAALAEAAPEAAKEGARFDAAIVWRTNDVYGQRAAVAMFDKAIANLENAQ